MNKKILEIPKTGVINFDVIADGLNQYLQNNGVEHITYAVTYHRNPNNWDRFNSANITFAKNEFLVYFDTEVSLALNALWIISSRREQENNAFPLFFEMRNGKYKGSVGKIMWGSKLALGIDPISKKAPIIKFPAKRNVCIADTATISTLVFKKNEIETFDSYGNTNEEGDTIIYVNSGHIDFGVVSGFDSLNKRIMIRTGTGTAFLNQERNMLNITKMPESSLKTNILQKALAT